LVAAGQDGSISWDSQSAPVVRSDRQLIFNKKISPRDPILYVLLVEGEMD
jgi:hypothetical protein